MWTGSMPVSDFLYLIHVGLELPGILLSSLELGVRNHVHGASDLAHLFG